MVGIKDDTLKAEQFDTVYDIIEASKDYPFFWIHISGLEEVKNVEVIGKTFQIHHLFLQDTPFLDVRAEDEFEKGSFPFSANHPILNNKERHLVGTCYKKEGQQAAIKLGHKLVSGTTKTDRISKWCEVATKNPNTHLHCWRGGMRSKLAQQWMNDSGLKLFMSLGITYCFLQYL